MTIDQQQWCGTPKNPAVWIILHNAMEKHYIKGINC